MLEYLRNAAEKPVAKILIGILAFSFVGWGVAEWVFGNVMGDNALVSVGDEKITAQQFNMEKSRELASMTREQVRAIYTDADAAAGFQNKLITKLATQRMAENRAHDLGFMVSDARIAREIRDFPEFQINGRFSGLAFDTVLNNSGYSEAEFADVLRNQIMRSMVLGAMSAPIKVPQFALDASYNARHSRRAIEYSTVRFADFKAPAPTDNDLREFHAKNPHMVPETRAVSYVLIPADMAKPDSYGAGYDTAIKVEDEIIAGESMAAAASKHRAKHVALKPFAADARPVDAILTDSMVAKIFDMEEGLESELIETKQGFVIMRVDKITPAHNAEFDSVKKDLTRRWARDSQRTQAYVRANEILVDVNKGNAMRNKKSATVSRASGAPAEVLAAAFSAAPGTNTIVPGTDAFYVLSVRDASAPKADAKKTAEMRGELQKMSERAIIDDYNAFLIREYPIKINEKVYKKFIGQ